MYKNFIKKFGLKEKNAIDKNVTHLVVSVNPQNCADRTLKFLQAITNKCWIISLTWVQECLTQNTLFIPESFEVLDTNNQPGPNRSRQGPLITDGRNSCKWTGPTVGLSKSFIRVKISGQNF